MIPARVSERAAKRYVVEGGCWISTYSVASHGYAQIGWWEDGKTHGTTVHRAAWTHHFGPIPDDMTVDHFDHCDHRCVNPSHLRLLSNPENGRRNSADGNYPLGWSCKRNHGVERNANGKCPECLKIAWTKYNRKVRAA